MNDEPTSSTAATRPHGMFAKIALDFPDDPKVINAGFIAELVYVRCTLYAKAARTDGVINRARLKRWLAGIPGKPDKHMAALVAVGLVEIHDEGWNIPLKVWCRWNKTADEIAEESQTKSTAGTKGNHVKHHVEKGVTHPGCRWCLAEHSHSASKVLAEPSQTPRTSSLEVETETEVETDSLSSSNGSSSVAPDPIDDMDSIINRIIKECAAIRTSKKRPDDPVAYHEAIVTQMQANERAAIAELLVAKPYMRTQHDKAAAWHELARTQNARTA